MTKNCRVPSRYTPSSVLYSPLLLPTFIRGVGATSTHFLLKVTFSKLSAFPQSRRTLGTEARGAARNSSKVQQGRWVHPGTEGVSCGTLKNKQLEKQKGNEP